MVLLSIAVILSFGEAALYFISGRDICLFATSLMSMFSCFVTFLMAIILAYSFLKSAKQIYVFSIEGRLPSKNEEKRGLCIFYITIILCIIFLFSYTVFTLTFYEEKNRKALANTYYISMFIAGLFALYLAIAYIMTLCYLNKTVAK